jgi:hypothetical protein
VNLCEPGTDLTVDNNARNPLWFTGNAVPNYGGEYRERKPWELIWEVAFGRASGTGRASGPAGRQHWRTNWMDWIQTSTFPY